MGSIYSPPRISPVGALQCTHEFIADLSPGTASVSANLQEISSPPSPEFFERLKKEKSLGV